MAPSSERRSLSLAATVAAPVPECQWVSVGASALPPAHDLHSTHLRSHTHSLTRTLPPLTPLPDGSGRLSLVALLALPSLERARKPSQARKPKNPQALQSIKPRESADVQQ